jgi:hypothetical protein
MEQLESMVTRLEKSNAAHAQREALHKLLGEYRDHTNRFREYMADLRSMSTIASSSLQPKSKERVRLLGCIQC